MADIGYDGQVAIITGSGGGLGREHALELARRGARVVVNDLGGSVSGEGHEEGPAHKTAQEINDLGGDRRGRHQQRRHPRGRRRPSCRPRVDEFGTVDIVINNAGILRDKTFHNMTPELLNPVIDVHLRGAFYVTQPAWSSCGRRATAASSTRRRTPASSATSASRTTAPPRWAWSASPGCWPTRAASTTSRPTPSPRSPRPA